MRKASAVDARGMQVRTLRLIGMFSLLLICAAVLWSGRVLAAQTPQVAAGVFDASASMQRSGMQPRLAGAANTISKAGAVVTLLPAGGASL